MAFTCAARTSCGNGDLPNRDGRSRDAPDWPPTLRCGILAGKSQEVTAPMPTYVVLFHLTHQGLDHLRGSPDRVDAAKKTFSQHGAKVKEFYSMMGQYDSMFIVEAPNDDVMAQLSLTVGAQGNVRTETHRAFNEEEYRKIVKNIP